MAAVLASRNSMTQLPHLGMRHHFQELWHVHVQQVDVVAGFQINVLLPGQQRVDDHVQPIGLTQGRYGAALAIIEQVRQIAFARDLLFAAAGTRVVAVTVGDDRAGHGSPRIDVEIAFRTP